MKTLESKEIISYFSKKRVFDNTRFCMLNLQKIKETNKCLDIE